MTRWLPYPVLALSLLAIWLLLTQTFSLAQVLLGTAASLLAVRAAVVLGTPQVRVRSVRPALKLAGIVLADILRSNVAVASLVLRPRADRVSSFVRLPVELRDRHALTMLALIITATPGTIWAQFDRSSGTLLVHVLDLVDEEAWIKLIKRRYEALLMEIFGQ